MILLNQLYPFALRTRRMTASVSISSRLVITDALSFESQLLRTGRLAVSPVQSSKPRKCDRSRHSAINDLIEDE